MAQEYGDQKLWLKNVVIFRRHEKMVANLNYSEAAGPASVETSGSGAYTHTRTVCVIYFAKMFTQ